MPYDPEYLTPQPRRPQLSPSLPDVAPRERLDRERFLLNLLRDLTGMLEDMVGLEDASGVIDAVGRMTGQRLADLYDVRPGGDASIKHTGCVLRDLKSRITGRFELESTDDQKLTFKARRCPFGRSVEGRESLCMMTSNVFGRIAAEAHGFAQVELESTKARGDSCCRVTVDLDESRALERGSDGRRRRDYFRSAETVGESPPSGGD